VHPVTAGLIATAVQADSVITEVSTATAGWIYWITRPTVTPRKAFFFGSTLLLASLFCLGCRVSKKRQTISYPAITAPDISPESVALASYNSRTPVESKTDYLPPKPLTNRSKLPSEFFDLPLDEAIAIALNDVEVLRSLSASIVQNTQGTASSFDPAIQATDPNFGIEAALSAFDTNLTSTLQYANNDDTFNNPTTTGSAATVQQDLTDFRFGLNKVTAAGTQLSLDSNITHDRSTNPALLFPSVFDTSWQATVRQPLLQGSGTLFNRIAGPTAAPGFQGGSGFLISRSNHDISIVEFERNINQMVLEIINVYWQLDLAYKNFASIRSSRDASLETWNISKARNNNGLPGGEADREAQARAQYYQFEIQLTQSLNSVLQTEADLRRLLGLPQSGDQMYRPSDSPGAVESVFDWYTMAYETIEDRTEIRQQRKQVEQQELLLFAAKSFTKPRLDAIATYRNNGFGDSLAGGNTQFSGALDEAFEGNFDEFEVGLSLQAPLGFRRAHAGVRNSELQLMRQRVILKELKQQILHDLGTAVRTVDQAYRVLEVSRLGAEAARESAEAREVAFQADAVGFEDLLDAQQRMLDAQLAYHNAKATYELAIAQVHFESADLLEEYAITFNEKNQFAGDGRAASRKRHLDKSRQNSRLRQHGFLR